MGLFETQVILNEDTFNDLKKHIVPSDRKKALIVIMGLLVIVVLIQITTAIYEKDFNKKTYGAVFIGSITIIVIIFRYVSMLKNFVKVSMKRLQETSHSNECLYTSSFVENGFKVIDHASNGTVIFYYNDIARFIEIKQSYVIMTKLNQFGLIDKTLIKETEKEEELVSFIKEKCPNIRFEKHR